MKRAMKVTVGLMAGLMSFSAAGAQTDTLRTTGDTIHLNLDEAIRVALSQNPTIVVDSMEVLRTTYAKKETLGSLYPSISLAGDYQYTFKKQKMTMNMGGQSTTIEMGTTHNMSFGFQGGMPLINVPLWKSLKLTEESINAKREAARETKIKMVSTITEAYYQLLNAKDSYRVLRESYNTASENLRITRNRFKNGLTSEYDTIQADVQVKNIEPSMIAAKNGIDLATLNLKILMGMPDSYPIAIDGSLEQYERQMFDDIDLAGIDSSLSDNPTVRQLEVNTRLLEKQLETTKAQWYPTLSLSAVYQWVGMGDDLKLGDYDFNPYGMLGLSLKFPIFQGMSRVNKQKEAQLQYDEMKFTIDNTKRQLRLGLQNSINNLRVALQTINSTKAAVKSAEKGLSIAQKRYEVGAGTTLELTTSQNAVTTAKLSYLQAIYDYIVAQNDVNEILGNAYRDYVE